MLTIDKTFLHSRTGYHGYLRYFNIPEPVTIVIPRHFNILEVVTMLPLVETFQYSRTGYHGYSRSNISTF